MINLPIANGFHLGILKIDCIESVLKAEERGTTRLQDADLIERKSANTFLNQSPNDKQLTDLP